MAAATATSSKNTTSAHAPHAKSLTWGVRATHQKTKRKNKTEKSTLNPLCKLGALMIDGLDVLGTAK